MASRAHPLGNINQFHGVRSDSKVLNLTRHEWKKVRSNKGAPGVDCISIEQFPKWGRPQWKLSKKQLLDGTYKPMPARFALRFPRSPEGCAYWASLVLWTE